MRLVLIALFAALSAAPAWAQQLSPMTGTTAGPPTASPQPGVAAPVDTPRPRRQRMRMRERFAAANTTHDGKLTLEQARAGRMPRIVRNFDAIDVEHRGYVTMEDIRTYARAQRAARKAAQ